MLNKKCFLYTENKYKILSSVPYCFNTIEQCKEMAQKLEGTAEVIWNKPKTFGSTTEIVGQGQRRGKFLIQTHY